MRCLTLDLKIIKTTNINDKEESNIHGAFPSNSLAAHVMITDILLPLFNTKPANIAIIGYAADISMVFTFTLKLIITTMTSLVCVTIKKTKRLHWPHKILVFNVMIANIMVALWNTIPTLVTTISHPSIHGAYPYISLAFKFPSTLIIINTASLVLCYHQEDKEFALISQHSCSS